MKKLSIIISIIFFLLFGHILKAQIPKICFNYDVSGNRIKRCECPLKIVKVDSLESIKLLNKTKEKKLYDQNQMQTISIFPNPTEGLLELKITGMKDGEKAEYIFVSLTGQELMRKQIILESTRIDISNFSPGTYLVNVTLDKKVETWKIIKH